MSDVPMSECVRMGMSMYVGGCTTVYEYWSEDSLWDLVFFLHVGLGDQTQGTKIGSKHLYTEPFYQLICCFILKKDARMFSVTGSTFA